MNICTRFIVRFHGYVKSFCIKPLNERYLCYRRHVVGILSNENVIK